MADENHARVPVKISKRAVIKWWSVMPLVSLKEASRVCFHSIFWFGSSAQMTMGGTFSFCRQVSRRLILGGVGMETRRAISLLSVFMISLMHMGYEVQL